MGVSENRLPNGPPRQLVMQFLGQTRDSLMIFGIWPIATEGNTEECILLWETKNI